MKIPFATFAAFAAILVPSFAQSPVPAKKLKVVASILPIQAHASAIAGDRAEVVQLLDKDSGPHDFQLAPGDVRKLADADLFAVNGAGLEEWLDKLVSKAGNKNLAVVDTSKGIKLVGGGEAIFEGDGGGHDGHDHGGPAEHEEHDGLNPHIWLDPVLAKKQAAAILAALVKADPANADAYQANAGAYFAKLDALDASFREVLGPLPNKNLVTFHDAFPYLAKRYGLNYVGYVEEFPEKDPSPKELAGLVDKIKGAKVGVLFAEEGYAPSLLEKIAAQTGTRVSSLDTLEVGAGGPDSYIDRMGANLESLRKAFAAPAR